jgi:hypothetical protein
MDDDDTYFVVGYEPDRVKVAAECEKCGDVTFLRLGRFKSHDLAVELESWLTGMKPLPAYIPMPKQVG